VDRHGVAALKALWQAAPQAESPPDRGSLAAAKSTLTIQKHLTTE
jgi:hypothetical protein